MRGPRLSTAVVLCVLAAANAGAQDLKRLQREFMRIGDRVIPATVIVRGDGAAKTIVGSSGVIISPDGLVLSDADAMLKAFKVSENAEGKRTVEKIHADGASIRLPDPDRRRFRARLIHRDEEADVSLFEIIDAPKRLPCCPLGSSDDLLVGSFAYVCGNSFGMGNEGKPALSAGIVSALVPRDDPDGPVGRFQTIYTSAAVNPGNNGGPLVDLEGRLIGIISMLDADPASTFRGFGRVTPIRRVLSRFRGAALAGRNLPDRDPGATRQRESRVLEQALQILARRASRALVSLEIDRGDEEFTYTVQTRMGPRPVPRYAGPYSAVCIESDGLILASTTSFFGWSRIQGITARFSDGRVLPAEVVARDKFRQIALLRVEAEGLPLLEPVVEENIEAGRFVLALGDPFGDRPHAGPLVTFGVVSAMHKAGAEVDAIQTDAGMNDANVGGPLIDLRGRLIGVNLLVNPDRFGRNSGVGFAVPVWSIAKSLPDLKAGRNREPAFLGILGLVKTPDGLYRFPKVTPDGPAHKGGLRDGDVLLTFDGVAARTFEDQQALIAAIKKKRPGDTLVLRIARGSEKLRLEIVLGAWPDD